MCYARSLQSYPKLCDLDDVPGILQARILEEVAISFYKRAFQARDQTRIS